MQNSYMYCVFCNSERSKVQNNLYLLCFCNPESSPVVVFLCYLCLFLALQTEMEAGRRSHSSLCPSVERPCQHPAFKKKPLPKECDALSREAGASLNIPTTSSRNGGPKNSPTLLAPKAAPKASLP